MKIFGVLCFFFVPCIFALTVEEDNQLVDAHQNYDQSEVAVSFDEEKMEESDNGKEVVEDQETSDEEDEDEEEEIGDEENNVEENNDEENDDEESNNVEETENDEDENQELENQDEEKRGLFRGKCRVIRKGRKLCKLCCRRSCRRGPFCRRLVCRGGRRRYLCGKRRVCKRVKKAIPKRRPGYGYHPVKYGLPIKYIYKLVCHRKPIYCFRGKRRRCIWKRKSCRKCGVTCKYRKCFRPSYSHKGYKA